MQIGSNFPVISNGAGSCSQTPAVVESAESKPHSPDSTFSPPSPLGDFERASAHFADAERFFKVDGLSSLAQQALSAYQTTESLAANNPRNQLVGVDVYA